MDMSVGPQVLIPRPETECLVETALEILPENSRENRILDLGTGTGAIILALARQRPENFFFASDRSHEALEIARSNALSHGLDADILFFCADWFSALKLPVSDELKFHLIVSNPPYIRSGDVEGLQPEISVFEPRLALDGGTDGLDAFRQIVREAATRLVDGGFLLLEIGFDQGADLGRIAEKFGTYDPVQIRRDYSGLDRIAVIRKKGLQSNGPPVFEKPL
jgi:release factor glutamine methyltransferase